MPRGYVLNVFSILQLQTVLLVLIWLTVTRISATPIHSQTTSCTDYEEYWDDLNGICRSCSQLCNIGRGMEKECRSHCARKWKDIYGHLDGIHIPCGGNCVVDVEFCDHINDLCRSCADICHLSRGTENMCKKKCLCKYLMYSYPF